MEIRRLETALERPWSVIFAPTSPTCYKGAMSENPDHDAIIAAAAGGIASRDIAATFRIGVREVNRVIDEAAEHAFGGEALPRDIYLEKNG